jgi:hypothetical protein
MGKTPTTSRGRGRREKYCKSYMQWLTYSESISSLICNCSQCYMSTLIITVSIALRYAGCTGLVANIRRHMRLCHPDIQQEVQRNQTRIYERKECLKCGVVTTRLDLHLQRIGYHMDKGRPRPNSPVCNPKT